MKVLFAIATLMLVLASPAFADCETVEGKNGRTGYLCDIPEQQPVVNQRPRCVGPVAGKLLCDGEIGVEIQREPANVTKPGNCRPQRNGKYICW